MMRPVFRLFLQIALLRAGPEQVPAARAFFWLVLIVYLVWSAVALSLVGSAGGLGVILVIGFATTLVMVCLGILLWFKGRFFAYQQTLVAIFGTDILFNLVVVPVFLVANQSEAETVLRGFAEIVLMLVTVWRLMVEGFIYAKAVNISWFLGSVLALTLSLLAFYLQTAWFGTDQDTQQMASVSVPANQLTRPSDLFISKAGMMQITESA